MQARTKWIGIVLIILGLAGFAASGFIHKTALIPSFFGIVYVGLAKMALKDNLRMMAMHIAPLLSLAGIGGTFKGLLSLMNGLSLASVSKSVMCVLCIMHLVWSIQSFLAARKERSAS